MFENYPLPVTLSIFIFLAFLIWVAGTRLSYFVDAIAEQTKIARAFLGLVLLATATELPELATTLTASASGNGSLALNNMFGGMLLQLCVLAIADMFIREGTLTSSPRHPTVAIAGLLSALSLAVILVFYFVGDNLLIGHVGLGACLMVLLYIFSLYLLKICGRHEIWSAVDLPDQSQSGRRVNRYDHYAMRSLVIRTIAAAVIICVCGALIVRLADTLAVQTGLGTSFIGVSMLAMTTSLPELSTSLAAIRVKAYTMAISNIFGSNLIMTFLIFPVDLAFTGGAVINEIDPSASFALSAGIVLTLVYCIGLLVRSRKKILGMGMDSLCVFSGYFIALGVLYFLK